jgi:hypothetical protein
MRYICGCYLKVLGLGIAQLNVPESIRSSTLSLMTHMDFCLVKCLLGTPYQSRCRREHKHRQPRWGLSNSPWRSRPTILDLDPSPSFLILPSVHPAPGGALLTFCPDSYLSNPHIYCQNQTTANYDAVAFTVRASSGDNQS